MEKDNISEFLKKLGMSQESQPPNQWDNVIMPEITYLIMGDKRMGKSALAYWLLETFGKKYDLLQVVVGLPRAHLVVVENIGLIRTNLRVYPW